MRKIGTAKYEKHKSKRLNITITNNQREKKDETTGMMLNINGYQTYQTSYHVIITFTA